jgi:[CysO sulfur-carrier protein]-S-L-cysteine hydrolase
LSTPVRLLVPRPIYEQMVAQAQAEKPNECCGLLAGRIDADGNARVERRYPLVNAVQSPIEYLSDAKSMFDAERDRRRRGLEFLAVYHSHPTSDPVPSKKDREQSYSPEVMNLIISLKEPTPTVRAWWLEADTQREADWEVVDS